MWHAAHTVTENNAHTTHTSSSQGRELSLAHIGVRPVKLPNALEAQRPREVHEVGQLALSARRRPRRLEVRVDRLDASPRSEEGRRRKDGDLVAELHVPLPTQHRRLAALDDVDQEREAGQCFADALHLRLRLRSLDKEDVRACAGKGLCAAQRLVQAVLRPRVGASNNEKVAGAARLRRHPDPGRRLLQRHHSPAGVSSQLNGVPL
mmetsp:Transcript_7105/g.22740  ORF Transcript_7105/g.22740 Transcript_7105/m.22740 type:complete len:207 (-) Transcript_7105:523-1143(-)